CET
ncbi:phosphoserine phosphatase SerB, partial [Vibrio parahaemolyticus V-223/04]